MRGALVALAALVAACASRPPPVTKIVGGRVIVTRSVSPSAYEHLSRALLYEEEERWSEAAAELQRALMYDGEAPELHARLAEVFLRLDRLADAEAEVRRSLALGETVPGRIAHARLLQARGDGRGAVGALDRAVALASFEDEPVEAENAHLELAEAALLALDAAKARRTLEALCRAAPGSLAGRLRLAAVAWALADASGAERRLEEILAEEPNHVDAWVHLAWLQTALGRNDRARAAFQQALDRAEGAPELAAAFARFLVLVGDEAAAGQLADDLGPPDLRDEGSVLHHLEVERAAQRHDQALALLGAVAKADPPEALRERLPLWQAQVLADRGDKARAVETLLGVARTSPSHLEARLRAAELLRQEGKGAEALGALADVSAESERAQIELAVARAMAEERQGDPARAIRRLEEALRAHPGQARLTIALAALEERRGQWRRALALVEPLLARDPGNVEALNFWGFVAADHGHELARATRRLVTALALEPGSGAILDSVGWAHFRAGDLGKAAFFLEQAGRLEPDDPEILAHLGELYARRAENERAAVAFRKALTLGPEDALRRRVEEALARVEAHKAARP